MSARRPVRWLRQRCREVSSTELIALARLLSTRSTTPIFSAPASRALRADFLHDAGALVPADHRQRDADHVTGPDVVVRVTQPGGLEGDQNLALARWVEVDLLDTPVFVDCPTAPPCLSSWPEVRETRSPAERNRPLQPSPMANSAAMAGESGGGAATGRDVRIPVTQQDRRIVCRDPVRAGDQRWGAESSLVVHRSLTDRS